MQPPAGISGMHSELLKTVPGYDPHVQKNEIIEKLGYGPEKRRKRVWEIDKEITGGRGAADHLPFPRRDLLEAQGQRSDGHGQQPVQWPALRGSLAGRPGAIERSGI